MIIILNIFILILITVNKRIKKNMKIDISQNLVNFNLKKLTLFLLYIKIIIITFTQWYFDIFYFEKQNNWIIWRIIKTYIKKTISK